MPSLRTLKILTALAAIGCLATWVSDGLLLAAPISGAEYYSEYPETLSTASYQRLLWGNTIGLVSLTLELSGVWLLHLFLRRSSERLSWVTFLALSFGIISGIAFHVASAFLGTGYQVHQEIGIAATARMVEQFETYREALFLFAQLAMGIAAACFAAHVVMRSTPFSKLAAAVNPLTLIVVIRFVTSLLPAPLGGFVAPGYFNLAMLCFFLSNYVAFRRRMMVEKCCTESAS